jgi:hypothetical protein
MLDYHRIGMAFSEPLQNNYFLNEILDGWAWVMIKMMYAPYDLPAQLGEVEDWVKHVSLNGARWSNICRPD